MNNSPGQHSISRNSPVPWRRRDPLQFLVVDDNDLDRMLLGGVLRKCHSFRGNLTERGSYSTGLEAVYTGDYDMVFVDHYLDESRSGLEFIETARQQRPEIPFVLLTGVASDEIENKALMAGAVDFIEKNALEGRYIDKIIRYSLQRFEVMRTLKLLEEEAQEARLEAEAASLAKTKFMARISHEVRTPLNAVVGFSELARLKPKKTREYLGLIEENGRYMLRLLDDMLDVSHIEKDEETIGISSFRLSDILNRTMPFLLLMAERKKIKISVNLPDSPVYAKGDPVRVRQIMDNIVGNAIKFSREEGIVDINVTQEERRAIISVKDHGVGIPAYMLPSLTEVFFRGQDSGQDLGEMVAAEGHGVGLYVVKRLLDKMSGALEIESEEGVGTHVRILLPVA